jgi:glyoxylase-like metal-dependent hydrolase (beta-lactamase superfamily II)
MHIVKSSLAIALLCCVTAQAHDIPDAPEPMALDALMAAGGWSFDTKIETQSLADGFYVLFGVGGNVLVSSGVDGVLMVDDQFPKMLPRLRRAMRKSGDHDIDFVINTHWHFDHADGNQELGKEDVWLVSQANSRKMMQRENVINMVNSAYRQKPYPAHALPDITFDKRMQFHFNGERIDLLHSGPAHTTGDAAVIFQGQNTVHMGDVFNNTGYPFIDADNGGSLEGVITFCDAVLAELDEDSIVVPGHGPVATHAELQNYVYMLKTVHGEMLARIRRGESLKEIQAAGITATWDEKMGDPTAFINRSYVSLTHRAIH